MEEIFNVRRFFTLITPSGNAILQNDTGMVDILDRDIVNFISKIDENKLKTISADDIRKDFPNNYIEVIKFLLEYKIIEKPNNINFILDELNFLSNDTKIGELADYVLSEQIDDYKYKFSNNIHREISLIGNKKTLYLVFLNPYSKSEALEIRNKFLNCPNSYLVVAYIYHNNLYIDSLYSNEWKTPCHICQINTIESDLRDEEDHGINYQKLIDRFYNEYEGFEVGLKLSKLQMINIITQLCNRIIKIIGTETNLKTNKSFFREGFGMDLKTFKTFADTTLHWEYCDCYE